MTFLHPLTIDSEYTRDVDDALSLETVGGEEQVGIHISDVATFLNGRRDIFEEACQRGISVYLPEQRIPMIPPAMSEGVCSLIVGEKRRALSFLVKIDEEGKVRDYQIVPSIIQVERRLSYEMVDQLLEEEEGELSRLHQIAEKLFRRRMEAGAFFIPRPERMIRVNRETGNFHFETGAGESLAENGLRVYDSGQLPDGFLSKGEGDSRHLPQPDGAARKDSPDR